MAGVDLFYTEADQRAISAVHIEAQLFRRVLQVFHGPDSLTAHVGSATVRVAFDQVEDSASGGLAGVLFDVEIDCRKIIFRAVPLANQGSLAIAGDRAGQQGGNDEILL